VLELEKVLEKGIKGGGGPAGFRKAWRLDFDDDSLLAEVMQSMDLIPR
jgi:hypothetical protein